MDKNKNYLFIGACIFVIFIIITSLNPFIIVNAGEKGVIRTFGRISPNVRNEGLSFRIPFINQVYILNVRPQTIEGDAQTYTKDNQPIDIKFNLIYSIPESNLPMILERYEGAPYEKFASPKIIDAIKAIGGKYTASEFITKREAVKRDLVQLARNVVIDEVTNLPAIRVLDIPITNVDFDDEYETAIKAKQVMQQKAQQKQYELQAAQQDAQIVLARAQADAKAIFIKAEALKQSSQLIQLEQINMMKEKWNGKLPDTLVTGPSGSMILPIK
ncbi:MAG: prohibitin family protein [Candidatus Gastranaerophilales bacterium]|nr:prohibitin family protein [Candidatus Gastranaerophilales bacterium]